MKSTRKIFFKKGQDVPNSPLPVVLIRAALGSQANAKAATFRRRFRQNGWTGIWTDTIYDYTHFHSNAHEVLNPATC